MSDNINITPDMISSLADVLKNNLHNNSNSNSCCDDNSSSSTLDDNLSSILSHFTSNSSSDSKNDANNFDINTILKIKSILETLNKKDDPKSNLLYSLKPYLRKSKQQKLDQYVNILKISQVVNLFSRKEDDSL